MRVTGGKNNETLYYDHAPVQVSTPVMASVSVVHTTPEQVLKDALVRAIDVSTYSFNRVASVYWAWVNGKWVDAFAMMQVEGDNVRVCFFGYDGDYAARNETEAMNKRLVANYDWKEKRVQHYGDNPEEFEKRSQYLLFPGVKTKSVDELVNIMTKRIFRK